MQRVVITQQKRMKCSQASPDWVLARETQILSIMTPFIPDPKAIRWPLDSEGGHFSIGDMHEVVASSKASVPELFTKAAMAATALDGGIHLDTASCSHVRTVSCKSKGPAGVCVAMPILKQFQKPLNWLVSGALISSWQWVHQEIAVPNKGK